MNTTTGKEQRYISYADMLAPEDCSISELIERSDPDWWREQDRAAQLHDFFTALDNPNSDASWLAEEENRLEVTESEWSTYRRTKAELAEARYTASPF